MPIQGHLSRVKQILVIQLRNGAYFAQPVLQIKMWISNKSDTLGSSLTPKPLKLKSEERWSELRRNRQRKCEEKAQELGKQQKQERQRCR